MCRSPFQQSISCVRGVCGLAIDRAHHNGHAANAAAHVRVHLAAHVRIQPPSVQNASGSREHEPLRDTRIAHREHGHPQPPRSRNRRSASSMPSPATPATAAATTPTSGSVPTSWPRCCRPPRLCSHHLQPKLPNPATERGSVDVSFSGGHKVGSRLKRCLPGVNPRCVLVSGCSSRDI